MSVTAAGVAAWVTSQALEPELAPSSCRWCGANGLDASVRNGLVWGDTAAANTTSNVLAFGVAPLAALGLDALAAGHDGALADVPVDALVVGQATVVAVDLSQVVKFASGRERPFVHALAPDQKPHTANPPDNNVSFFSGHTTATFALAAAAGTVATMRGYRWAPIVWITGAVLAAATGYLRIAADQHWLTDVLTGAAVGAGVGFGVPYVFHRPSDGAGAATDKPGGWGPIGYTWAGGPTDGRAHARGRARGRRDAHVVTWHERCATRAGVRSRELRGRARAGYDHRPDGVPCFEPPLAKWHPCRPAGATASGWS